MIDSNPRADPAAADAFSSHEHSFTHTEKMSGDLACTYAALILHDDGQEVTADKMAAVVSAAGLTIEPYWTGLFAKFLETKSVGDLISNVGAGGTYF